jgi:hypothetical protein
MTCEKCNNGTEMSMEPLFIVTPDNLWRVKHVCPVCHLRVYTLVPEARKHD